MQDIREPVGSNIYDAICFLEKQIDHSQAIIDHSVLRMFANSPTFIITLGFPFIVSFILFLFLTGSEKFMVFPALLFAYVVTEIMFDDFISNNKRLTVIVKLLDDLKILYGYDSNMDVGFQLNNRDWFDETVIKAMMKKRKKEIMQRPYKMNQNRSENVVN